MMGVSLDGYAIIVNWLEWNVYQQWVGVSLDNCKMLAIWSDDDTDKPEYNKEVVSNLLPIDFQGWF